ncbi:MAG: hypothetical protein IJO52_10165 [Clostridia bacterium]|nr:hypothetical protein [Clostridia bacterium]
MAFTKFDGNVENITSLPDEPSQEDGYTAAKIKALFDKAAVDLKDYINNTLIPELTSQSASAGIGSEDISGLSAENNVFSQISALKLLLDTVKSGGVDEASITPDKLNTETQKFINGFNSRCTLFTIPGSYTFTVPRSGVYKVTAVGGGAAGASAGGGMSGACGVKWFTFTKNQKISATVGAGGKSNGVKGDNTVFGAMIAEGGKATQSEYTSYSTCTNADISIDGAISVYQNLADNIARRCGGDSPLGRGSKAQSHSAGTGAGGFGDGDIFNEGGDGIIIIEYMNIQ